MSYPDIKCLVREIMSDYNLYMDIKSDTMSNFIIKSFAQACYVHSVTVGTPSTAFPANAG